MAPLLATQQLAACQPGDIAWILSFCAPCVTEPSVERDLKMRGCKYIFHVMDDWFDFDWLREGTILRCQLADLIVVPTPQLACRVHEFVPSAKVEVFEEPIDTNRLRPSGNPRSPEVPTILWNGNPFNFESLEPLLPTLQRIGRKFKFSLRVVCGQPPPKIFGKGLQLEWRQFDNERERNLIAGSSFGIAPMADTGHNRCKGAYKIKTYCASGLAVVASPVGFQGDLVRDGDGIGFLPNNETEWEQAILTLLQDPNLALHMGAKALGYAESRFSYKAVTDRWARSLRVHFDPQALT